MLRLSMSILRDTTKETQLLRKNVKNYLIMRGVQKKKYAYKDFGKDDL